MNEWLRNLVTGSEEGQTLIEYVLILFIVSLAIVLIYILTDITGAVGASLAKIADLIRVVID